MDIRTAIAAHGCGELLKLGAGINAEVYAVDENTVLRVSCREVDGFRIIHLLPKKWKLDYPLVNILATDGDCSEFALVERLYPIPYLRDSDLFDREFWEQVSEYHIANPHGAPEAIVRLAEQAIELHRKVYSSGFHVDLDFGPNNIMQRKNGTLVLSDPFGYNDI